MKWWLKIPEAVKMGIDFVFSFFYTVMIHGGFPTDYGLQLFLSFYNSLFCLPPQQFVLSTATYPILPKTSVRWIET